MALALSIMAAHFAQISALSACKIWAAHALLTASSPVERASGEKIRT